MPGGGIVGRTTDGVGVGVGEAVTMISEASASGAGWTAPVYVEEPAGDQGHTEGGQDGRQESIAKGAEPAHGSGMLPAAAETRPRTHVLVPSRPMGSRLSIIAGLLAGLLVAGALLLGFVFIGPAPAHPSASAAAASDSPAPSTAPASPVGSPAVASDSPRAVDRAGVPGRIAGRLGLRGRARLRRRGIARIVGGGRGHALARRASRRRETGPAPQPLIAVAASPMIPMISPGKNPSRIVIAVATASPPHSSRPWRGGSCADTGSRMYM